MKNQISTEFNSLFEEDYLLRTLGSIGHDSEVALTELVANAWDAGASVVEIKIPDAAGKMLEIQDNGHGMNPNQFRTRWMTLGYDRVKHQGSEVIFPPERKNLKRLAYGRNGVGRHGLLCFADQYAVETWTLNQGTKFVIGTQSNTTPFRIESETKVDREGSGTKLSVLAQRRIPDPERIREILANRFIHDPQFKVTVNGKSLPIEKLPSLIASEKLKVTDASSVIVRILIRGQLPKIPCTKELRSGLISAWLVSQVGSLATQWLWMVEQG